MSVAESNSMLLYVLDVSVETGDKDGEDSTHEEGTYEPLPSGPKYAAPNGPIGIFKCFISTQAL